MHSFVSSSAILASTLFSAVRAFDVGPPSCGQSLAVYWGQGAGQKSLGSFCADSTIDIIPIAFVNVFPDQNGTYGYPGTNFGNACAGYYVDSKNETTQLLGSCPQIGDDITYCQSQGKRILLSLGGGSTGVFLASDDSAVAFGDFLHGAFGPPSSTWSGPRPFGDACVDGFDFDIEASASAIPVPLGAYYATMVNHLRTLGTMMITASPQCIVPDANLGDALTNSYFDAIFVQFYNTPQCSARAYFDNTYGAYGGPATDISYDSWISWMQSNSKNPDALVYLGLPAAPGATYGEMYLNTTEAQEILTYFQGKYPAQFGGAMLWEATFSDNNQVNGVSYAANIKSFLIGSSGTSSTTSSLPYTTPTNSANGPSSTLATFSPTGTGSGFPTGVPTMSPTMTTNASGSPSTYTPTDTGNTYTGKPTGNSSVGPVTTTDANGNTHTYTPSQGPITSPTNSVVTTTDRNGNTFTYTPTNIQPTGASPSTTSSFPSSTTTWSDWDSTSTTSSSSSISSSTSWGAWDPSSSTASPVATSASSTSTSWGVWDPTTTASTSTTSMSSLGWTWHFSSTTSTSSISWEATITASDASTVTIMPLPASSHPAHSIASWSSYWTQRGPVSSSPADGFYTQSSSTPAAPAATSSSAWSFTGWASAPTYTTLAPLPSIATVSPGAATSAGAVGASPASASMSAYVQPGTFTGAGSVSKPIFGVVAAVVGGVLVMVL